MLIAEGLPFIRDYVAALNNAIKEHSPEAKLSQLQCCWLSFVILGILVTNSVCWTRFQRFGMGSHTPAGLSWMFRRAKIAWEWLLRASTLRIIERYKVTGGILVLDDTDRQRSKNTVQIGMAHKIKDKKTGGYFNGQNILFLLLVSKELTIPVGFEFHQPDPDLTAWRKLDRELRIKKVSSKHRPPKPEKNSKFPEKKELAIKLVKQFVSLYPAIKIKAVLADLFYGSEFFMKEVEAATGQKQIISQIRKTQLIHVAGKLIQIGKYFANYQGKTETVKLRYSEKEITYCGACFKIKSHNNKKYRIVALKYENEEDYRYIIATDMTWLMNDIIQAYAMRWLVEVFIQDWKSHEGWENLAMQPGVDGSVRGVTMSLLCDHALHFHDDQLALFEKKSPAATVGSLRQKVMIESLTTFIESIIDSDNPKEVFSKHVDTLMELFELRSSVKHMRDADIGVLQNAEEIVA